MTGWRFHCTMEMIPALPWYVQNPSVSTPINQSRKQGDARGASEVRRGTSSIHFHCPVPRSSSHIGHGKAPKKIRMFNPYRTPKIRGKEEENAQTKKRRSSQAPPTPPKKTRNSKKKRDKEGKGGVPPKKFQFQNSPNWGQSQKIRFSKLPGSGLKKFSELCPLLFFRRKSTKCSQNPGLVNKCSATLRTLRGQLSSSAKWWFSLLMIWGFWGLGVQTS